MLDYPQDFGATEDHVLLRTAARDWLRDHASRAAVRGFIEAERAWDPDLWKGMGELGWLGLVVPERAGGAGLGALHLALLLEEMGRALYPSPYLATVLATLALDRAGDAERLRRIADGELVATVGWLEPHGSWEPEDVQATCEQDGEGFLLRGHKAHVMHARDAGLLVAPFREADALRLVAVALPTEGVEVEDEIVVDPTRPSARLRFDGARVPASAVLEVDGPAVWREVLLRGAAALAAEMIGGAETLLLLTRDYANERVQFGRAIGSFQAVKHPIVDTMIAVEQSRTLAYAAAAALDAASPDAFALCRMAKAFASDAYVAAGRRAVQLHGGFGFTWECDVHFWLKRALWSRAMLGDAAHHHRHLASALLADGP